MAENKKDICRVMVSFPCTDNAIALQIKTAIDKLFEDNPDATVQFMIMSAPVSKMIKPVGKPSDT